MAHEYDFALSNEEVSRHSSSVNIYHVAGEMVIEKSENLIWSNPWSLELYSMDGKVVLSKSFTWNQEDHVLQIPVQNISPGSYVVRVDDGGSFMRSELVIVRQ